MLKYDKIDISEGIDLNKTNKSKECMFCHYWYYLNKNFSYGPFTCDGCYNIVQKSIDFKDIAIIYVKKTAYRVYFVILLMIYLIKYVFQTNRKI